jgi:hypothetical protein
MSTAQAIPATTTQSMSVTSGHHKLPGGIIAAIVILCLVVVAIVIAAIFLSRRLKPTVDLGNCLNQANHGVTAKSGKVYWLGALSRGVSLFTSFELDRSGTPVVAPYNLTAFGMINAVAHVTSPMMGNPFAYMTSGGNTTVTPPPPPSVFQWRVLGSPTLKEFQAAAVFDGAKPNAVEISTAGGDPLCRLVVMSLPPGGDTQGDICFLCSAPSSASPDWQPLTVIGGLVWPSTATGDPHKDPWATYNVGCMPLSNLIGAPTGAPTPGVAWLNCYPQVPLIGSVVVQPGSVSNNMPNHAQTPDPGNPVRLRCNFDPSYQTQQDILKNPPPDYYANTKGEITKAQPGVPPPTHLNTVLGCQALPIPAFDIVAPSAAGASTLNYLDAIYPIDKAPNPAQTPLAALARVGNTSAIGILRMRKWIPDKPSCVPDCAIATVLQASNPTLTNNQPNPYAGLVNEVPKQYVLADQTVNAATLLFGRTDPMWKYPYDTYEASMCAASTEHVSDPAVENHTTYVLGVDEPIMSFFYRPSAYVQASVEYSSVPQFVVGWGLSTGILYMRCGQINTEVYDGAHLVTASTATCGQCMLPTLVPRTFCWPPYTKINDTGEDSAPYLGPEDTQLLTRNGGPGGAGVPPPIAPPTGPLDNPYIALGAPVGRSTILVGGHAASVRPWAPVFTAPTGDEGAYGFGKYSGSGVVDFVAKDTPPAQVFLGVFGLCNTVWSP